MARFSVEKRRLLKKLMLQGFLRRSEIEIEYSDPKYAKLVLQWFVEKGVASVSDYGSIRLLKNASLKMLVEDAQEPEMTLIWAKVCDYIVVERKLSDW